MLKFKHILIPVDFSQPAQSAIQHGLRLALIFKARVTLLHVVTLFDESASQADDRKTSLRSIYRILEKEANQDIKDLIPSEIPPSIKIETKVVSGFSIAEEILSYAGAHDVDLIAMGTRGKRPLSEWLIGSVAQKIVKLAGCPVLAASSQQEVAEIDGEYRRILVAVDFSEHSQAALGVAAHLAGAKSRLTVMHVIDDSIISLYGSQLAAESLPDLQVRAGEALENFVAKNIRNEIETECLLEIGNVTAKIIEQAEKNKSDIIIMGRRGKNSKEPGMLGSVSEKVIQKAPCPVLVMK
jgi:nucleotide-binding universal stress UspA family protein